MLLCWRWLSSVVPAMGLYGLWCCGMDDLFVWFWLWILLERQRKSGGCSFSACFETFKATSVFPSSSPSPLLGSSSPSSKTMTSYEHCVTGWSFSISFPLLARPLFPWYSAAREVNLLPILFLNIQAIRIWCVRSSKRVYCLSYLMTHQDLFICGCFEHSSPEGTDYLCPSKAFNILIHLVFLYIYI